MTWITRPVFIDSSKVLGIYLTKVLKKNKVLEDVLWVLFYLPDIWEVTDLVLLPSEAGGEALWSSMAARHLKTEETPSSMCATMYIFNKHSTAAD